MALSDFVSVSVSLSNASSPTVNGLNTGLVAGYHNHYAQRVKVYSTATALTSMVTDGFLTTEPTYKAVAAYAAAPNAPALVAVGRRALPFTQILQLSCVDGTINDSYDFTVVGSTGKSTAVTYKNVQAPGTAGTGTVAVTASTAITFSTAQTMTKGDFLTFSSQPGVYYALSAAITAATAGVLTTAYTGTANAAATYTHISALTGTFNTVNGASAVVTTVDNTSALPVGSSIQFGNQVGQSYVVASVTITTGPVYTVNLTTPFTGPTLSTNTATPVCFASTAASAIQTQLAAISNIGTPTVTGSVITLTQVPGALTDIQGWAADGFAGIQLQDLTADPGIAADRAALRLRRPAL